MRIGKFFRGCKGGGDFGTVIRRIGGLEINKSITVPCGSVIRRIGGLENTGAANEELPPVIRRIGGLEK